MDTSGRMFHGGAETKEPGVQLAALASRPDVVPGGPSSSTQRGQASSTEGEGRLMVFTLTPPETPRLATPLS